MHLTCAASEQQLVHLQLGLFLHAAGCLPCIADFILK